MRALGRTAVVAAFMVAFCAAAGSASPALRLTAALDRGARLGSSSAIRAHLAIDSRRLPSPVTRLRVLYPKGLDLLSSGLAGASCERPEAEFVEVLVTFRGLGGCSPNSVLGYGTARAEVRLVDGKVRGQVIPEYATLTLFAGPIENGTIGLLAVVDGQHPFGARLVFRGHLGPPTRRYGGSFNIEMPAIPSIRDLATVAVVDLALDVGSRRITYYRHARRRTGAYHPASLTLPSRCPRGGLAFRADVTLENGAAATAVTHLRCPGSP